MRFRESLAFIKPDASAKVSPLAAVNVDYNQPWNEYQVNDDVSSQSTLSTSHGIQTPLTGRRTKGAFLSRKFIVLAVIFIILLVLALLTSLTLLGILYSSGGEGKHTHSNHLLTVLITKRKQFYCKCYHYLYIKQ